MTTPAEDKQPNTPDLSGLNEAPASLNFYAITSRGYNLQVTLRDRDEYALMGRFIRLTQWLDDKGVKPKPVGQQPRYEPAPADFVPPLPDDAAPVAPGAPSPAPASHGDGGLTFAAETLTANMADGKTYWKVKGGKFAKWGVTIWPEALTAAGLDPDKLNPTTTYNLTGYTAHYVEKDGKANKVTQLVK